MNFKIFFLLIAFFLLFSSSSLPQWQVDGGKLIWPNGPVMPKTLLVYDDPSSFQNALTQWVYQGSEELPALIYKNAQNLSPALSIYTEVDSIHFTGSSQILGGMSSAYLSTNHGEQSGSLVGFQGVGSSSLSGLASWGSGSSIVGLIGSVYSNAAVGTIPNAIGVHSFYSFESGANDTITNAYGFKSEINQLSGGNTLVDSFYSFYSSNDLPANVSKFYHFYGSGDYPSFFGGATIQKVYTYDVENPPTRDDLDSAFGPPEEVGPGFTAYINDANESSNFYQVVSDGQIWWVFTASQAP